MDTAAPGTVPSLVSGGFNSKVDSLLFTLASFPPAAFVALCFFPPNFPGFFLLTPNSSLISFSNFLSLPLFLSLSLSLSLSHTHTHTHTHTPSPCFLPSHPRPLAAGPAGSGPGGDGGFALSFVLTLPYDSDTVTRPSRTPRIWPRDPIRLGYGNATGLRAQTGPGQRAETSERAETGKRAGPGAVASAAAAAGRIEPAPARSRP